MVVSSHDDGAGLAQQLDPDTGRREPTMTLAGWRRFVDTPAARFDLLPDPQWAALSSQDKDIYDEARLNYHSEMIIVATSAVREVARQGRLLTLLNRREISARRGLIVSGQQTTGKTTALKQLGRTHELMIAPALSRQAVRPDPGGLCDYATQRVPAQAGDGVRPVPRTATGKPGLQHHRYRRRGLPDHAGGEGGPGPGRRTAQPESGDSGRRGHVRPPQILHRAPARDVRLRRDRRRAQAVHRGARQTDRRPLRADQHRRPSPTPPNGRAWSPRWRTRCVCTATSPAP